MITIDQELCKACGICGNVCPRYIPETIRENGSNRTRVSQERIHLCMGCGQCGAVCPNAAIEVDGLNKAGFAPVEPCDISERQMLQLLRQRRSVRRYKKKPVSRAEIDRIIDAVSSSPIGTGRSTTGVIVVDDPQTIDKMSRLVYAAYEDLGKKLNNPIARFFMKRKMGRSNFRAVRGFVMPGMEWYIRWYREGRSNEVFRDCPALMLFHSPIDEPIGSENCIVAAYQAIIMAQVLNIGACFNGLIPPVCNRVPEIKNLIGLSDGREVYSSITLGYSKYEFKRVIPRTLAEVRYI